MSELYMNAVNALTAGGNTPTKEEISTEVLRQFAAASGMPPIDRIVQEGTDAATARYTIHFTGGPAVRIGTIDTLWSQAELSKVLIVAIQCPVAYCKPLEWTARIGVLARFVIEVREEAGETFEDAVAEWLDPYLSSATSDKEGAAAGGMPFTEDDHLHVTATDLVRFIQREYGERVKRADIIRALRDLGFQRTKIDYATRGGGHSSKSYYRIAIPDLAKDLT